MNSNENINPLKAYLLPTLIGIILTAILEGPLKFIYSKFLTLGAGFIKAISDSTYQEISKGLSEQSSMFISYFVYLAIFSFTTCFVRLFTDDYKREKKKHAELTATYNTPENVVDSSRKSSDFFESSDITAQLGKIEQGISAVQKQLEENKQKLLKNSATLLKIEKRNCITGCAIIISLLIITLFAYARMIFINNAVTITTNNIEIVSPYISDQDYKQLKSDFHSIQNREDYERLHQTLDYIAKQHGIALKE